MNEQIDPMRTLASTARWAAAARAGESAREDRLFDDPYALALAGEEGMTWLAARGAMVSAMVIRTRYFDDLLLNAAQHGIDQIVILAAGLDTRAYRLPFTKNTRIFELDQPAVLEYKDRVLREINTQPSCDRTAIPTDLNGDWQADLLAGGYNPALPAAWLLEGFLFYIPTAAIIRILETVTSLSAPGSRLGFDLVNCLTLTSPITHAWIEMQAQAGAPWIGALDDPESFLAGLGWTTTLTQPGAPDANYGRWTLPIIPVKMPNMPHNWYVTAQRET